MALFFRNLDVTPDDPVEQWGVEGVLAAIDLSSYVSGDVVQSTAMFLRLERLSVDCETSQRPHVDTLTRGGNRAGLNQGCRNEVPQVRTTYLRHANSPGV